MEALEVIQDILTLLGGAGLPRSRDGSDGGDYVASKTGTGGLLIIYANDIENNGKIASEGSSGGGLIAFSMTKTDDTVPGGGGSGGGSINIFYAINSSGNNASASGGAGGGFSNQHRGGKGGDGSVTYTQISL